MPAARGRGVRDAGQPSCLEQDLGGGGGWQRADARCTGAEGKMPGSRAAENRTVEESGWRMEGDFVELCLISV